MIQATQQGDTVTIHIAGRFDFRCVKEFNAVLAPDMRSWIVDLGEVDYVDSAALGLLLLLREHAGVDTVRLRHLRGQPRDVLLMAKFDRLFTLED
jgi:anti-anti-sigma factor